MIKSILFLLAILFFAFNVIAQGKYIEVKNPKRILAPDPSSEISANVAIQHALTKYNDFEVSEVFIGKAAHQRGVRREEAHLVDYNYDLEVISVTNIPDPATYDQINELGVMAMWYSTDHGMQWSEPVILFDSLNQGPGYYLSGGLFNPPGNNEVENMYGIAQGTINPNAGDWRFLAFGSSTLGGEYQTNYIIETFGYGGYYNIFGYKQFENEVKCMNLIPVGDYGNFIDLSFQLITGEFDAESHRFDWDLSTIVELDLAMDPEGLISWIGMYEGMDAGAEICWSNFGDIGYMWVVGVHEDNPTGYQPVLYYTENFGEDWDYIYLDFFTTEMQEFLEDYLVESSSGIFIPHVFESSGVVDLYGKLQMIVAMGSSSADVINNPDSLGYHWDYPGDLFNIVIDEEGIENIIWIDSLNTKNVLDNTEGNYCESAGWQHRLGAAKSEWEKIIIFTWTDTRNIEMYEYNLEPDIFVWAKNQHGPIVYEPICFTQGTQLEGTNWFTNNADEVYSFNLANRLLCLKAVNPPEFWGNSSPYTDPITLSYVNEMDVFSGLEEYKPTPKTICVSQNIPNPFSGKTNFEIYSASKIENLIVEVNNIFGQVMYTLEMNDFTGTQQVELTSNNFNPGIYFYTVHADQQHITKKMIVRD